MTNILKLPGVQLPENVANLVRLVVERNPTHQKYLAKLLPTISAAEFAHLDKYLAFCIGRDIDISYLADSYLLLVADAVNELVHFMQNGEYRYSTLQEVGDQVYHNAEYMNQYMHGVAISLIFWASHLGMHRFFAATLPRDKTGNYLEIGPGHGTFLLTAMQTSKFDDFRGIDISATSVAQTRAILDYFVPEQSSDCTLMVSDFFDADVAANSCDAVVMGEVLEHVENPGDFLAKIREVAKDDAYIFVTTCVNAPQIDHIYLFRTLDEVSKLFASQGLKIISACPIPYEGKTLEECAEQQLPINVAYVLGKIT